MRRLWLILGLLGILIWCSELTADPSRYPQFAQQHLPKGVAPDFISLDRLVDEIVQGKKPMIIDVRSREEYEQSRIKGSISIPLGEIPLHLAEIPRDKLVVLY